MEREPQNFKRSGRAHLLLGIVLMLFGLFIIADMADIIPWRLRDFIFTWQALLILLGVIFYFNKESKGTGIILIAIGTFFLLPSFFHLPNYWRSLFLPGMLILLGLVVIFGGRRHGGKHAGFGSNSRSFGDDLLDDVTIFGGGDRTVTSQQFRGGKITHIFGGSKYDFSCARLASGENRLELVMAFGGTKLIVPEEWNIKIEITSIFGGFSDKRVRSIVEKDREKTLLITGINVFGGGEIVNYI